MALVDGREGAMSDIFISYAREDQTRAQMLARALETQGWSIFWDRRIPTGKSWRETIGKELAEARCVIVLWSKTSVDSNWVQDEADDARRRGVLFPVLIESVVPPFGFRSLQAADLANWDGKEATQPFEWLISDLVKSVGSPRVRSLPKGWFAAGAAPNDYEMGFEGGGQSGYIKSRERPRDFGTLMTIIEAAPYRGKRVRMTGYAKSLQVQDWAGFWMRIDGPNQEMLGFDNMQDRPIIGTTERTKSQIVLDVPAESIKIAYGVLLGGDGQVWFDGIEIDVVGEDIPTTGMVGPRKTASTE
jgi:hypothetical protein